MLTPAFMTCSNHKDAWGSSVAHNAGKEGMLSAVTDGGESQVGMKFEKA